MVSEVELTEILQTIPWFQALSDEHFHKIAGITDVVALSRDEVLFKQGDQQKSLYVVVKGRVGVEIYSPVRGALRVFTAEPMDVVGWSSVTPVIRQRTATARAVLDSLLIAIDATKLNQFCEQDHELGFIVMRRLANVAASRVMICRLQLVDLFANPMGDCDND